MTDEELNALLASKRTRLAAEMQRQSAELRARQAAGQQLVGPWAPARRVVTPRRPRRGATVTPLRKARVRGTTVKIGGREIRVVSRDEAEQATFVVCGPISHFADDVHATCAGCRAPIVHRPHVPSKPPKVCLPCAVAMTGPTH